MYEAHSSSLHLGNILHNQFKKEVEKLYNINRTVERKVTDLTDS